MIRSHRSIWRAGVGLAIGLGLALGACSEGVEQAAARSVADGSAKAALQAYFDSHPQCASVLSGTIPLGLNSRTDADASPGERALFQAGLLQEVAKPNLVITPDSPLADRALAGYARYAEPTPAAKHWFRIAREAAVPQLELCYAKRRVTNVWLDGDPNDPRLRYAYRLVDAAPWTGNEAFRRTFPFLTTALGRELPGPDSLISFEKGGWTLSRIRSDLALPTGQLDMFSHCPPSDEKTQPEGCASVAT